jgi:hypothetical protein
MMYFFPDGWSGYETIKAAGDKVMKFILYFICYICPLILMAQEKDHYTLVPVDSFILDLPDNRLLYEAEIFSLGNSYAVAEIQTGETFIFSNDFEYLIKLEKSQHAPTYDFKWIVSLILSKRTSLKQTQLISSQSAVIDIEDYLAVFSASNLFLFSKNGQFIRRISMPLTFKGKNFYPAYSGGIFFHQESKLLGIYIKRAGILIKHWEKNPNFFAKEPLIGLAGTKNLVNKKKIKLQKTIGNYDEVFHENEFIFANDYHFFFEPKSNRIFFGNEIFPYVRNMSLKGEEQVNLKRNSTYQPKAKPTAIRSDSECSLNEDIADLIKRDSFLDIYHDNENEFTYRFYRSGTTDSVIIEQLNLPEPDFFNIINNLSVCLRMLNKENEIIFDAPLQGRKILRTEGNFLFVFVGYVKFPGMGYKNLVVKYQILK